MAKEETITENELTPQKAQAKLAEANKQLAKAVALQAATEVGAVAPGQLANLLVGEGFISIDADGQVAIRPPAPIASIDEFGRPLDVKKLVSRFIEKNPHWRKPIAQGPDRPGDEKPLGQYTKEEIRNLSPQAFKEFDEKVKAASGKSRNWMTGEF